MQQCLPPATDAKRMLKATFHAAKMLSPSGLLVVMLAIRDYEHSRKPTWVWYPSGRRSMKIAALAARAASRTSSSLAPGVPKPMFAWMSAANSTGSCARRAPTLLKMLHEIKHRSIPEMLKATNSSLKKLKHRHRTHNCF